MSVKNFSSEELAVIKKIQNTGLYSRAGTFRMYAFVWVAIGLLAVGILLDAVSLSLGGFGDYLVFPIFFAGLFVSIREMNKMGQYQDELINLFANRLGFEVLDSVDGLKILDRSTLTYYSIDVSERDVTIQKRISV